MRRVLLAVTLAAAVLTGGAWAPASATSSPSPAPAADAPTPAGEITFGVQTSSATRPDGRGLYSWSVTPGAAVTDFVAVVNTSNVPLRLSLYGADALNTAEGGYDLLPAGVKSRDVGAWLRLDRTAVDVPARGRTIVGFRLRVPLDASPGDHSGGIVASLRSTRLDDKGNQIEVDQRVGARTYLRVAGPVQPALEIEKLSTSYDGALDPRKGRTTVTWTVHNSGNVRLAATQAVEVDPWLGRAKTADLEDLAEILPGNRLSFQTVVDGVPAGVRVGTTLRLDPRSLVPGDPVAPAVADAGTWAIPWTVLVALALVLGYVAVRRRESLPTLLPALRRGPVAGRRRGRHGRHGARATAGVAGMVAAASLLAGTVGAPLADAADLPTSPLVLNAAPATGNGFIRPTFTLPRPCPSGTTSYFPYLHGPGFPADGQPMLNNPSDFALSTTQPFAFQADLTFRDTAARSGAVLGAGRYALRVICQDDLSNKLAVFVRRIDFRSADAFAVVGPPVRLTGSLATPQARPAEPQVQLPGSVTASSPGAAIPEVAGEGPAADQQAAGTVRDEGNGPWPWVLGVVGALLLLAAGTRLGRMTQGSRPATRTAS